MRSQLTARGQRQKQSRIEEMGLFGVAAAKKRACLTIQLRGVQSASNRLRKTVNERMLFGPRFWLTLGRRGRFSRG